MSQYRSSQERVDDLTMKLVVKDKMVGSGYVDYGPQVPFQSRITVQPSTIKPDDVPEWFNTRGGPIHGQQRAGQYGHHRPGGHHQQPHGHQQHQPQQHHRPAANGHAHHPQQVPGYHPQHQSRPAPPAHPHPAHHQQQYHQQPKPVAAPIPTHRPTTPGVFDTNSLMQALHPGAAPSVPTHVQAPPPPAAPRPGVAAVPEESEGDKKMSKAQKAKLRKKLREGKLAA